MADEEPEQQATEEQVEGFLGQMGLTPEGIGDLIKEMLTVQEEDRQFRAAVMERFTALLNNQKKMYKILQSWALQVLPAEVVEE